MRWSWCMSLSQGNAPFGSHAVSKVSANSVRIPMPPSSSQTHTHRSRTQNVPHIRTFALNSGHRRASESDQVLFNHTTNRPCCSSQMQPCHVCNGLSAGAVSAAAGFRQLRWITPHPNCSQWIKVAHSAQSHKTQALPPVR